MNNNLDPRIDFLVNPFIKLINKKGFSKTRETMHIFRGVTGQGKTYTCIHDWIPALLEKNVRLLVYSVPFNEIRQDEQFEIAAAKYGSMVAYDFGKATRLLKNKEVDSVILVVTNQNWTGFKGKNFQKWLITNIESIPTAFILDESHTWTVSCDENYKKVTGNNTPSYDAVLFKQLTKLSRVTPYIFGMTATPNAEMIGTVITSDGMDYIIVNEMAHKSLLISKTAWLNSISFYEKGDEQFAFENFLHNFCKKETVDKPVMMIQACQERSEWNASNTLEHLKAYLDLDGCFDSDEKLIVVLTDKKKFVTDLEGNIEKVNDETALDYLRDPEHPARFLIVVEKGKCGMNVHNLSSYFSFRFTDKKDGEGTIITTNFLQTAGRFVRPNASYALDSNSDLTNFVYSVKNSSQYTKSQKARILNELIDGNSFDICVPNTDTWVESMRIFREDYCSSTIDAREWIESV